MEQDKTTANTQEKKLPETPLQAGAANSWFSERQQQFLAQISGFIPGCLMVLFASRLLTWQLLPWALLLSAIGLSGLVRHAPARKLFLLGIILGGLGALFFLEPQLRTVSVIFMISALFMAEGILLLVREKKSAAPVYFRFCGIFSCAAGGFWAIVSLAESEIHEHVLSFANFVLFCAALQLLIRSIFFPLPPIKEKTPDGENK